MTTQLRRAGFTVMELVVALGILSVAMVLVAQIGISSLAQRRRTAVRHEALEAAANVLESAQARPWDGLTPAWAAAQRLPEPLARKLSDGKLTVRVEAEKSRPHAKRVTVEVHWQHDNATPAQPVVLVGLFGARAAHQPGDRP